MKRNLMQHILRRDDSDIRRPISAGRFYPDDPAVLASLVERFLAGVPAPIAPQVCPNILIVPHASYMCSGFVAGTGYAQVRQCSTVILMGVSHHKRFAGAAIDAAAAWRTPLGQVPINDACRRSLMQTSPLFFTSSGPHRFEHALEVQLPFLQKTLRRFKLVPLLLGKADSRQAGQVSRFLASVFDDQTLLVTSSDLSHYPVQADAEQIDHHTIGAILTGDPAQFRKAIDSQMRRGVPGLVTCACGAGAIEVAMRVARLLRFGQIRLVSYSNSGEVSGDPERVVGYASIAFAKAS